MADEPLYDVGNVVEVLHARARSIVRAVDGVDLHDRRRASSSRSRARAARARRRCCSCSARSTGRASGAGALRGPRPRRRCRDSELAELRLRAFGFVFQQFNLIPTLTALQNVEVGARADRASRATSCASARAALLDEVGLADRADAPAGPALGRRAAARRDRPRARRSSRA